MSSDSVSFLGGGIFVVVMLEVLTSGKDTDRYHFAEQGFVALHIFILSQDFNLKILAWRTSRLLTGRWDLFLATGSNFRVREGRDDTRNNLNVRVGQIRTGNVRTTDWGFFGST